MGVTFSKVEEPKPKTNFVHVDEPEKKDALDELIEKCNKAAFDAEPTLGCFQKDNDGRRIWASAKLTQCVGEISKEVCCLMDSDYASKSVLYEQMAKMLFFMEVIAESYDDDLKDIVKEAIDITDAPISNLR